MTTIVWFRQDLRLADNPALDAAAKHREPIIPVYIWAPQDEGEWPPGAASRWWLHQSLHSLGEALLERGSQLVLAQGHAPDVLLSLVKKSNATAVYWNRRYEPAAIDTAKAVEKALETRDIQCASFNSALLAEPWDVLNLSGKPYRVYTPYRRRMMRDLDPSAVLRTPSRLRPPPKWPRSAPLASLGLMPRIKWYTTIADRWQPGEAGARAKLDRFVKRHLAHYLRRRDRPALDATSGLSPHLHFGEIGPRQIWHALGVKGRNSIFLHELVWREFAYHVLYHFPETTTKPFRPELASFPWEKNAKHLRSWQRGRTGVPMVDAGLRELWSTGVMHNRARMIAGSFLVKNLLQPWQDGARWFWDTLVDADLANNSLNWQWLAGCGTDAAPWFRIFNPVIQGKRYDPQGEYVRRWVPELARFPNHSIHAPWRRSTRNTQPAPEPIVDLEESRERALEAWAAIQRPIRR